MKKVSYFFFIITFLFISSCVYFNTLYNARVLFKEGQKLPLRENGKPSSQANSKYNKAMKKCGYIITEYENSKYVDDALFLLSQCFFYKQNYSQARLKFEDLIKYYPKSEYVGKAKVYKAQCFYCQKKENKAFSLLQELLASPKYKKEHPHILMLLANYSLEKDSLIKAEYYLLQLIEKYPKSKEKEQAITILVKTYIEAEDYNKAIEMAKKVIKSRTKRNLKLDAQYYEIYCYLMTEQYKYIPKKIKKLIKKEPRKIERAKVQLLKARYLTSIGETEKALLLLDDIKKQNRRTLISAEASYRMGEIYFFTKHDYMSAIESFNEVKTENKKSIYYKDALTQSAIASQIQSFKSDENDLNSDEIVEQSYKLAEHYYAKLNMPDSALIVYNNIDKQFARLLNKQDSLYNWITNLKDSLQTDSLDVYFSKVTPDTSSTINDNSSEIKKIYINKKNNLETVKIQIEKYKGQHLPFTDFLRLWIAENYIKSDSLSTTILEKMIEKYPENKYTYSASELYLKKKPTLINVQTKNELSAYNKAFKISKTDPLSAISILDSLIPATDLNIDLKANLLAGNIYFLTLKDTVNSKIYYDKILKTKGEYNDFVSKIYYDGKFKSYDRLDYFIHKETKIDSLNKTENDSLNKVEKDELNVSKIKD